MKLLLVEDDATLRYMIRNSLEVVIGGYEMAEAANGAEGLELWKTFRPDIIVADVEMPVMDGYEMVAKIRETDRLQPIVFASGMEDPSHVMRGYEVGVDCVGGGARRGRRAAAMPACCACPSTIVGRVGSWRSSRGGPRTG